MEANTSAPGSSKTHTRPSTQLSLARCHGPPAGSQASSDSMVHGAAWKPGGDVGTDPRMAPAQRWGQAGPSSPESGDSRSVSDGATRQPLSQRAGIRLDKSRFSQARECGRRLTWEVIMMLESIKKLMAKPREAHAQLSTPQRSRLLRPVHLQC